LNSAGGVLGYYAAGSRSERRAEKTSIGRIVLFRSLLSSLLLLTIVIISSAYSVALLVGLLILLGFANAIFLVSTLALSMELIPAGRAGLFNVLIGLGGAFGSFIGPFIAQTMSFVYVFIAAGVIFFMAYAAFRIF
jgi:MFS family permease